MKAKTILNTGTGTGTLGYSDFHNLMGFTSKKMQNNILYNICLTSFSLVKPFVANLHSNRFQKY